jgi:hypothetical protein
MPEPQACIEARSPAARRNSAMRQHYEALCKSEMAKQGKGGRRRGTKKAGRRHRRKTSRR